MSTARESRRAAPRILTTHLRGVSEICLVFFSAVAYSLLCFLVPTQPHLAFANARQILALEHALGIDVEHTLNLWLYAHPGLANLSAIYYSFSFFSVTCAALVIVWKKRHERYAFARNSLFLMTGGAALTYWIYPLAPPRLIPELGYVDVVATQSTLGSEYTRFAHAFANPYAAMPSMHTGWALWSAIILGAFVWTAWWQRLLLLAHPAATIAIVMTTGNHYILDVCAGISFCIVAIVIVGALTAVCTPSPCSHHLRQDVTRV